jgi:alkanesulfonate monooxygenase SsuD/methylene tetrahydromethanopterin reductase-like flavin-dependent oxidoreductase (luciferase family)
MPVEFAIWDSYRLHELEQAERPAHVYERHLRQVQRAEELGFRHYFTIEHQSSFAGHVSAPTVLLAALSQRTTSIRLGAMIWQLPLHNPVRLAQDVAMLDQLSEGRVEFGAGIGVHEHEFLRWNVDFSARQAMGEEALEIIQAAWTKDEVTYRGKFWTFDEAIPRPKPYQRPHPPIWAAVHSRQAVEFAARKGFDVAQNIDTDEDIAEKFALFDRVWAAQHRDGGRRPRKFLMRAVLVAETDDRAHELAAPHVREMYSMGRDRLAATRVGIGTGPYLTGPIDRDEDRARRRVFSEVAKSYEYALRSGIALVGSPESVAGQIEAQCKAVGGLDVYCCEFHVGSLDSAAVERSMELFGRYVIPALR